MAKLIDKLYNRLIEGKLVLEEGDDASAVTGGGTKLYKHTLQLDTGADPVEEINIISTSSAPITSLDNVPGIIVGDVSDHSSPNLLYYTFRHIVIEESNFTILFGDGRIDISFGYTLGTDTVTEL